jgi:hypothetical protein
MTEQSFLEQQSGKEDAILRLIVGLIMIALVYWIAAKLGLALVNACQKDHSPASTTIPRVNAKGIRKYRYKKSASRTVHIFICIICTPSCHGFISKVE